MTEDLIYKKQRTGLNMYLEATLENVKRLIPDLESAAEIGGIIQMNLEEVKNYLDSAPKRRNLRGEDLDRLKIIYQLTNAKYKKKLTNIEIGNELANIGIGR